MKRPTSADELDSLAAIYDSVPQRLRQAASLMRKANIDSASIEVNQLFNTYARDVPRAASNAFKSVEGLVDEKERVEMMRAITEGDLSRQPSTAAVGVKKKGK